MAKVLNCTKYHKTIAADHRHHHCQQQQIQTQQIEQQQHQLLLIKQQQKQRQTQTSTTTNQRDNVNNNKSYGHSNNNRNGDEFIKYTKLQKHNVHDQQAHFDISGSRNFQQLTSVSTFSVLKNRNSKINNSCNNVNNTRLPSLAPPSTPPSIFLPPSKSCSYSQASLTPPSSTKLSPSSSTSTCFSLSSTYSSYSTCCVFTYNMFTAYAEAATLQLKRKTQFNKILHVSGYPDMRSICYLILMAFFYWGVMIRAAVATNLSTTQEPTLATHVEELNIKAKFYSNLTTTHQHNDDSIVSNKRVERTHAGESLLVNSSLKLPISALFSDDTLTNYQRRLLMRREAANVPDFDDDDSSYHDDELDEYEILINNKSALGKYIGAPCNNSKCESTLLHVSCEKDTNTCGCEKNYPVQLGLTRGCDKPKKLGEQCFYDETCQYNDENSLCVQVRHNAMCQCASGFHSVSYTKPTRRVFCTQDIDELNSDLPTLLGVCVGIGVLAGLICMVLHLFSKTKYPRHRNFGDANLPPPIMYSSETGIPLTVQSGRPSSRSSMRSSGGSIGSYGNRRSSTGGVGGNNSATSGSKGILVSTSRTGAARSAAILLISCHLTALSKQSAASRVSSRQTSGAGCSANSRDNLDENGSDPGSQSCDSTLSMTRHLQKQLNHQRHLLSFELSPAKTKNHDRVRALLGLNGVDNYRSDDDALNSLDNGLLEIGALPTPASETPRFAVLAALRFYATGCYQRPVGEQWGISMSQPSISRCIHSVTNAINHSMFFEKVKFPMTQVERQAAKATFASASSCFVRGTIGAVDCTHISILAPKSHEEAYVNHHGYHSLNVQMICDPNLKILNVNAKYPGARHDSYIWSCSAVRRVMQRSFENGNHNMFLIGSRRPSLASVHSTSSSVRSYSMMRFEKEQQQKEIRQEMKLRLARLQQHQQQQQHQQHLSQYKPQIIIGDTAVSMQHGGVALNRITMATPSPLTPNSTDELLPAVDESQEYQPRIEMITNPPFAESVASATISAIKNVAVSSGTNQIKTGTTNAAAIASSSLSTTSMDLANAAYIGPCSSSNEAL